MIKGGGPVPLLVRLCKAIWLVADAHGITLQVAWIPRLWNAAADALSKPWKAEPALGPRAWSRIAQICIDHRVQRTRVLAPTFSHIARIVQRSKVERQRVLLVAPLWAAQSWFATVQEGTLAKWDLGTAQELWTQRSGEISYPNWRFGLFLCDFARPKHGDRTDPNVDLPRRNGGTPRGNADGESASDGTERTATGASTGEGEPAAATTQGTTRR
jgi:hypothetical protein